MSMPINADLHCHSVVSDGTLSPEELALRAHQNGVHLWSLTDHDVLGGQARAQDAALNLGMEYVSGVEISISWMGQTVHIVGLGFDPSNVTLQDGLRATRDGREERARQMAAQLAQIGIENSYEGALKFAGNPELIARTHFARYLVEQQVCRDMDEVFRKYLVAGKPGYVSHRWASLDQAVDWITGAGGEAVIAHPGRYRLNAMQMDELYARFKDLGGAGIEVVTGSHSPDQYQTYAKVAKRYGFLASRGSDFHDPQESDIDLGQLPHLPEHLTPIWSAFH
ncbi:MAG: PHP domain-containing protein [Burkholderiaceae bacterium]|uniref:3',5'-nucleoside bisphosphate phosphatase n=1 Tax=Polynucleobacter sp. HIN8 TaxID=3047867 RepID=UPI001D514709|nr:3',5'-nucleoside bisphosphate phosphatase [Polynucleobacter sp. HIN8]NBP97563.1 PHP domain-containing protein [Burkholderiaceae bacterium]NCX66666.1 PHP domain-containing protein [Burkholderiaceae bacterium]NCZ84292.1 PHP domain-containing protein [Burkholderiaceae bacterium]BEI38871.1 PHP domain-containing protein [Polynucleobacter sp. HIN8]